MTIADRKITQFTSKIADLADKPSTSNGYTAAQVKEYFDSSPEELRVRLNGLIDDLLSTTDGAKNIGATVGGLTGEDVQTLLEALKNKIDSVNPVAGFVNIKDPQFGATGDGTTDDTVAKDAANAAATGEVYFPAGTYLIDSLAIRDGIVYRGAGMDKTIIKVKGAVDKAVYSDEDRIYYASLRDLTIECDNKAQTGLDVSGFDLCTIKNVMVLRPITNGVYGQSSTVTEYDTAVYLNELTNVKVYFSTDKAVGTYGFKLVNGANSNRLNNCISQRAYTGFWLEDNVGSFTASNTNNVLTACNPEPSYRGFYIDSEANAILFPRIEQFTIGVEFGSKTSCRNNVVLYPVFYTMAGGGSKFVNANTTKANFYWYVEDREDDFVHTNQIVRAEASDGNTYYDLIGSVVGALRGGQTGLKWTHEMKDADYRMAAIVGGNFKTVFTVQNTEIPVLSFINGARFQTYTTANRPTTLNGTALGNYSTHRGYTIFDETLGKLITWKGTAWVDGAGTTV